MKKIPMDNEVIAALGLEKYANAEHYALIDDTTAAKYVRWLSTSQWRIKGVLFDQWDRPNGFWVECSGIRLALKWSCIDLDKPCKSESFMAAAEASMMNVLFSSFATNYKGETQ